MDCGELEIKVGPGVGYREAVTSGEGLVLT